jgi:FkbM family methyltransferase
MNLLDLTRPARRRLRRLGQWVADPRARALKRRGLDLDYFRSFDLRWLRNLDIRLVVDVGAYVGDFSAVMHELFPEATIVAFEPIPDVFAVMTRRLHDVRRFTAVNAAVGAERGRIDFWRSGWAPSSSALRMADLHISNFPESPPVGRLQVQVVTLDETLDGIGEIDGDVLVKVDVQGYESRVLLGAARTLRRAAVVLIETSFVRLYETQSLFDETYHFLCGLGFEFRGNHAQLRSPLDDSVLQADSIFVSPSRLQPPRR